MKGKLLILISSILLVIIGAVFLFNNAITLDALNFADKGLMYTTDPDDDFLIEGDAEKYAALSEHISPEEIEALPHFPNLFRAAMTLLPLAVTIVGLFGIVVAISRKKSWLKPLRKLLSTIWSRKR